MREKLEGTITSPLNLSRVIIYAQSANPVVTSPKFPSFSYTPKRESAIRESREQERAIAEIAAISSGVFAEVSLDFISEVAELEDFSVTDSEGDDFSEDDETLEDDTSEDDETLEDDDVPEEDSSEDEETSSSGLFEAEFEEQAKNAPQNRMWRITIQKIGFRLSII